MLAFLRIVQMSRSAQVLHELMWTEGRLKSLYFPTKRQSNRQQCLQIRFHSLEFVCTHGNGYSSLACGSNEWVVWRHVYSQASLTAAAMSQHSRGTHKRVLAPRPMPTFSSILAQLFAHRFGYSFMCCKFRFQQPDGLLHRCL